VKTVCLGAGPAGLYFAILTKKARPDDEVIVFERNNPGDTFGFGVVFSDRTLDGLEKADPPVHAAIGEAFAHWDDIAIHARGTVHRSTGHGFAGLSRRTMLHILEERARELGVVIRHGAEFDGQGRLADGTDATAGADLIVVADGVNSAFRTAHAEAFQPSIDWRPNWFVWLGTTFPFEAFTFHFKEVTLADGAPGLFQVHAYRFEEGGSTFIVECHEDVFRRSGLAIEDEAATVAFLEKVFAEELQGHRLQANRSLWRRFPVIRNASWRAGRAVLLGDAAHTAHFSIGSGTKLALEDALALREAVAAATAHDGTVDVDEAIDAYVRARRPGVDSLQRAAQVSLEWFEETDRHLRHDPLTFAFSLLTRSLRVTHANLGVRDPALVAEVDAAFEAEAAHRLGAPLPPRPDGKRAPRPPMFVPFRVRDLVLDNRVAVSPMCMYSAEDGTVDDWHLVHLGSRAVGGAGLVLAEMTDVSRDGRISPGCAGMYRPEHVGAWRRITGFIHRHTASKVGIQIGHAGRKGATKEPWFGPDVPLEADGAWPLLAASAIPWTPAHQAPRAMTRADMDEVIRDHVHAAEMAVEAGFDWLELHAAHGYLLSTFLSPLTNHREDEHGGSIENRLRFPLEVFRAVRAAWPQERPMSVRISAADWAPGGIEPADVVAVARGFKTAGVDVVDVSSAGTVPDQRPAYGRVWQLPLADLVRNEADVPVMSVGNFSSWADVNGALAARRADLCLLARAHLWDPYWVHHAAAAQGYALPWPKPYGVLAHYNFRFE
jgi:anthraniloyl-CoA monooxygenase